GNTPGNRPHPLAAQADGSGLNPWSMPVTRTPAQAQAPAPRGLRWTRHRQPSREQRWAFHGIDPASKATPASVADAGVWSASRPADHRPGWCRDGSVIVGHRKPHGARRVPEDALAVAVVDRDDVGGAVVGGFTDGLGLDGPLLVQSIEDIQVDAQLVVGE